MKQYNPILRSVVQTSIWLPALTVSLALALVAGSLATGESAAQSTTSLAVDAISNSNTDTSLGTTDRCIEVDEGDTFSIDITVSKVVGLTAWEATLIYDQSMLELVESNAKLFLSSKQGSNLTVQTDAIQPGGFFPTGALFIGAADKNLAASEVGSGVLARLTFEAIDDGVSKAAIPQGDLDGNGTSDVGARLLGQGGEGDAIGDINGDGFFDGSVAQANIAVDEDCPTATPEPTMPITPGPSSGPTGSSPTSAAQVGSGGDSDSNGGVGGGGSADGGSSQGGGSASDSDDGPSGSDDPLDDPGSDQPGDTGSSDDQSGDASDDGTGGATSDDGDDDGPASSNGGSSGGGFPVWPFAIAALCVAGIGAAGLFTLRMMNGRSL